MKANRLLRARRASSRRDAELAGAEVIGALILFGLFVTVIAVLNVTAVPDAGLAAEQEHYEGTLSTLNSLQSEAETAGIPANAGSTVARSIDLAPPRSVGQDFFSFFLATPARSSGELTFSPDYGNLSVLHYKQGTPTAFYDIGGVDARFPVGRLTFDPHPAFRHEGVMQLENGGLVVTDQGDASMRFEPPVTVAVEGATTVVSVKARVLNGSAMSIGGIAPVRAVFETEAATLSAPASPNAVNATLRLDTAYGDAWAAHLERISLEAGLTAPTQYHVSVRPAAEGMQQVTWIVNGTSTGNDVSLTTGLAIYHVTVS